MFTVARRLPASPAAVWDALVDTTTWSVWGPSVAGVALDHPGPRIGPGSTGRVRTAVGVWLPFTVTDWEEGRRWAWSIGPVPATGHGVEAVAGAPDRALAVIDVPVWAPAYAPLCWVALGRIGRVAAGRTPPARPTRAEP
jgi:uncharacterized protein YndB with AHSA1/START domain